MKYDYDKVYSTEFSRKDYSIHPLEEYRYTWTSSKIPLKSETLLDIGSGRGIFLELLKKEHPDIKLTSCDLRKFSSIEVDFIQQDVSDSNGPLWNMSFDVITCLDMLEHIHPNDIDGVLERFSKLSKFAIFTISNHSDTGDSGQLHLIQEGRTWWEEQLKKYWRILDTAGTKCGLGYFYFLEIN